jgi:hypothetical protein
MTTTSTPTADEEQIRAVVADREAARLLPLAPWGDPRLKLAGS